AGGGGDDLEAHQQHHGLHQHLSVERVADESVADSEYFGNEPPQQSHSEAAYRGHQPLQARRNGFEFPALPEQQPHEAHRDQTTHNAERGVEQEFDGVNELIRGHVEERLIAEDQVQNDPRGGGAQYHRSEHGRVHVPHDFFEREQNGGDRS